MQRTLLNLVHRRHLTHLRILALLRSYPKPSEGEQEEAVRIVGKLMTWIMRDTVETETMITVSEGLKNFEKRTKIDIGGWKIGETEELRIEIDKGLS
ncbi:unnamed protein product [Caenorhabditis nigoni]